MLVSFRVEWRGICILMQLELVRWVTAGRVNCRFNSSLSNISRDLDLYIHRWPEQGVILVHHNLHRLPLGIHFVFAVTRSHPKPPENYKDSSVDRKSAILLLKRD